MNSVTHVPGLFCYPCPGLHRCLLPTKERTLTLPPTLPR